MKHTLMYLAVVTRPDIVFAISYPNLTIVTEKSIQFRVGKKSPAILKGNQKRWSYIPKT